jgi:hypothetical protein
VDSRFRSNLWHARESDRTSWNAIPKFNSNKLKKLLLVQIYVKGVPDLLVPPMRRCTFSYRVRGRRAYTFRVADVRVLLFFPGLSSPLASLHAVLAFAFPFPFPFP